MNIFLDNASGLTIINPFTEDRSRYRTNYDSIVQEGLDRTIFLS